MAAAAHNRWWRRGLIALLAVAALVAVVLAAGLYWLDTSSGRAYLARNLTLIRLQSGLTLRAERIDGSIYGRADIHGLIVGDPLGDFARVPRLTLDWRPLDLLQRRFTAQAIIAPDVMLARLPKLRDTGSDRILPDFDFAIARLEIRRLHLAAAVAGRAQVLAVAGNADIQGGRARVRLDGTGAADTLLLRLDARPDDDVFDLDARLTSARGGVASGLLGLDRPISAAIAGKGQWRDWRGRITADVGGARAADLALTNRAGFFTLRGTARPAGLLSGMAARLIGESLAVDGSARLDDVQTLVTLKLASKAIAADVSGNIVRASERIENGRIVLRLLDLSAISPRLSGQAVMAKAGLAGTLANPLVDYRLTAQTIAWDKTSASDLVATGIAERGPLDSGSRAWVIPVDIRARAISGLGETASPLLMDVRISGPLRWTAGRLTGQGISIRTSRLSGTGALVLGGAVWQVTARASLPAYALLSLGLADVVADLRVGPAAGGGAVTTGKADVQISRLDNGFFAALAGGLPQVTADFTLAPDLSLGLANARLMAPKLTLAWSGSRTPEGIMRIAGSGTSSDFGPVALTLAGPITAPDVDVTLSRPGYGITAVSAKVVPAPGGWRFTAVGQSAAGPMTARGIVATATGPVVINMDMLAIAGITGSGRLVQAPAGPFAGTLDLVGQGLSGTATFGAAGNVQRMVIAAKAGNAALDMATPVTIEDGRIDMTVLLPASGPEASGSFAFAGLTRGSLIIEKSEGTLRYADGAGTAKLTLNGRSGVDFALTSDITAARDQIVVAASGLVDGRAARLEAPAIFRRSADGWILSPVKLVSADGTGEFSGQTGTKQAWRGRFDKVSLGLIGIFWPSLDVSGRVTGNIDIAMPAGEAPRGTASLRINGLSRASTASASTPIDVGLNANLGIASSVVRAVIVRGSRVEGRAQARLGAIPDGPEGL
ncbi:hypothetical protein, partial [Sandarakinorhabdus sp.]|uniref:hypothetical protein n=1 Tax=Sandarakinorhabdus sp. TaxID=1916663 RepID=UPI00286E017D